MRPVRTVVSTALLVPFLAAAAAGQGNLTPPRLLSAEMAGGPWNVRSGGIAACDVTVDATGAVTNAEIVQDVAPYGQMLADAVRSWRFEPARQGGQAVASRVLVLGFFRPPELTFAAPANPKYKSTTAPDELPWPTAVAVPPYPPRALGGGMVVLEADVSESGAVAGTRVLSAPGAFDGAATDAVKKWTFRPARRGNRAAASRIFMLLTFSGTTP